ncbi:coproporphyrinogen-III oxidase family protein [Actinoplanes sp. NPDC026619]|uniref:coproporphyrinogen-III oxidase family protein n=1 Tax=Actinoplanes sp. NPDC026619 TaxID=3155798 RepID=UPI0033DF23F5
MDASLTWHRPSVYVHFPYCRNICDFCNYETRLINRPGVETFATDVATEVRRYGARDDFADASISSLFFGGGTASLIPLPTLATTLDGVKGLTGQAGITEVTLECEPGTIHRQGLMLAKRAGVNRVGVCAQSFDDDVLRGLTRQHGRDDALRLIDDALAAGIDNLHVDLMYGVPGQSEADWRRTVEFTASLPIQHVSAYKFYVFKNGAIDRAGTAPRPSDEPEPVTTRLRAMHDLAVDVFAEHGLQQYTLTEFARPGFRCDYLINTFGGGEVLPLGPSAFGRCRHRVWRNPGLVALYHDSDRWDRERRGVELDQAEQFKRNVLLGLWLLSVKLSDAAGPEADPSGHLLELLDELASDNLIERHGDEIRLAPHQRFGAGTVMRRLAELDAAAWIGRPRTPTHIGEPGHATTSVLTSEMRSLLRVLRSDPTFVTALRDAPETAVSKIADRIPIEERNALLAVVKGVRATDTRVAQEIGQAWVAITSEHARIPRQRVP